ncbi:MAG: aminotransferase class I/II-fold pyridoxal phosphate-dependent enzyme [Eubacterium sp.]|nr:aminotransferase class I/II-fold pyridoxal phosphate-dependent enzyme [Eubacterium sp.]
MNATPLRIEQYATVLFNANLNPKGIPNSVTKAIKENIDTISKYPDIYYNKLKKAVAEYVDEPEDNIVMGNGSTDLLKLFGALIMPKKALIISPGPTEYESVLKDYNSEIVYFDLKEEDEFELSIDALIDSLTDDMDLMIISNPNNPTSKKVELADLRKLAEACKEKNIFLLIDEMYIEFVDEYKSVTAIHMVNDFDNLAVLRAVSKFFAVPGLRFAYAIMNNPEFKIIIDRITTKNNIASLSAIAITDMFQDREYITESTSTIHTERSLVYLAMSTSRSIHLYKPDANFMLVKLLKDDITASDVAEHCKQRGVIIRKCDDIRGLSDKFIRFCFMNPKQNDLMVNTILEIV